VDSQRKKEVSKNDDHLTVYLWENRLMKNIAPYIHEQFPDQDIELQDGNILQGMRFLCAEDNELNTEILIELLKIEGAECTVCENGEEILEAFEQSAPGDYDMILMDVQMPVMNGHEATKAIRRSSHELAKTIPSIAMTANAFTEDIQHSLAAGMNAHVSKLVDMKMLEKTIRSIKSGLGGVPNRRSRNSDKWI
jgi:CheY-like chemotaxis protein